MELSSQIRRYRTQLGLSQEALAERVYVTRQTVSNWENGRNYPDIHSLLLLSALFGVSLDQLVKGDIEIMRETIEQAKIERFGRYGRVFTLLYFAMVLSFVPLILWFSVTTVAAAALVTIAALWMAFKVERLKKENDIHTYKEIVAFTEGRRLDEIQKQREIGKRPYQMRLLTLGRALLGFGVFVLTAGVARLMR